MQNIMDQWMFSFSVIYDIIYPLQIRRVAYIIIFHTNSTTQILTCFTFTPLACIGAGVHYYNNIYIYIYRNRSANVWTTAKDNRVALGNRFFFQRSMMWISYYIIVPIYLCVHSAQSVEWRKNRAPKGHVIMERYIGHIPARTRRCPWFDSRYIICALYIT